MKIFKVNVDSLRQYLEAKNIDYSDVDINELATLLEEWANDDVFASTIEAGYWNDMTELLQDYIAYLKENA